MAQAATTPNTQPSNVDQGFRAFNFQIPSSVTGSVGALSSIYSAYGQFQKNNPLLGSLSFTAALPHLRQAFPDTFNPEKYQDTGSKNLITGLNTGGQAARAGLEAYGIYSNLQQGNYIGAGQGAQSLFAQGQTMGILPDFTTDIEGATGVKPVSYGKDNGMQGYAPYANGALSAYNAARDLQNKNYVGAAVHTAQAGQAGAQIYDTYTGAGNSLGAAGGNLPGLDTLSQVGGYAGAAYAAYDTAKNFGNVRDEDKGSYLQRQANTVAANFQTSGLYSVGDALTSKFAPGVNEKFHHVENEFNKTMLLPNTMNAFYAGSGEGAGEGAIKGIKGNGTKADLAMNLAPGVLPARAIAGAIGGVFGHKSVKKRQDENWDKLIKSGVKGAAEQKAALDNLGDKKGKDLITGEKWNFDKANARVKAGAHDEFRGVRGNYQSIPGWADLTDDQQRKIVARNAEMGNYHSKDGDVLFRDEALARRITNEVVGGLKKPTTKWPVGINPAPDAKAMTPEIISTDGMIFYGQQPKDKIALNLKAGKPPQAGLSKEELAKLYLDMAKTRV